MTVLSQVAAKPPEWGLVLAGSEVRSRRRWGPCPACGADDRRGVLLVSDRVWTCTRCHRSAGSLITAAILAGQDPESPSWRDVARWVEAEGLVDADDPLAPAVPDHVEVRGSLPPLRPVARMTWDALAAGVPWSLSEQGARTYVEARHQARTSGLDAARQLWALARNPGPESETYRLLSVLLWMSVSSTDETITIPRGLAYDVERITRRTA